MKRALAIACACWFLAAMAAAQSPPTAPHRGGNPEAAKVTNPAMASPDSVSAGRRVYARSCANCHGLSGKGDGPGAASGGQPADLTDATWDYGGTDGEMFGVIHDGTSADMGGYAGRLSDADIWNLVNYIRTLAVK